MSFPKTTPGYLLAALFILATTALSAKNFALPGTYFQHLATVNAEWWNHPAACPEGTTTFTTDAARIQRHLHLVIDHLLQNETEKLTLHQRAHRHSLLRALRRYADRGVFPRNRYHPTRRPYFVDEAGTHCAVGQMMATSGHHALVATIRREHNYDYLADIETAGVAEWAAEHGFTVGSWRGYSLVTRPTIILSKYRVARMAP